MASGDPTDFEPAERRDPAPPNAIVTLTPAAFLLRGGGVRRMAVELHHALGDIGYDVRSIADVRRPEQAAASPMTQARTHLSAQLRSCRPRHSTPGVTHSIYYDPPVWNREPLTVTVHDMIHERFGIGSRRLGRAKALAVKRADIVVCDSEQTRRDLLDHGLSPRDAVAIALGVSAAITVGETVADPFDGRPYLLHVGDRAGYKNFALLLDALQCCAELDAFGLVLVGGPPLSADELQQMQQRRRGATVVRLDAIDDAALGALYRGASALAVPSRYEGFGLSVLEAMACGCPVASTRAGSLAEFDDGLSQAFDPDDPADCARAVLAAIDTSDNTRRAMMQHASTFTWARTAAAYADVYERLLTRR